MRSMNLNVDQKQFVIEQVRNLAGSAYVIRFSRNGIKFVPGQYLLLGLPGSARMREYSIYSGLRDEYLEVLISYPGQNFFPCGGSSMIRDATDILQAARVPREQIFTEIYF